VSVPLAFTNNRSRDLEISKTQENTCDVEEIRVKMYPDLALRLIENDAEKPSAASGFVVAELKGLGNWIYCVV
jgi:hypothetical protein